MIIASMASIPEREATLEIAVQSLLPQVDHLHVYLNGYDPDRRPEFLRDVPGRTTTVWVSFSQNHRGDIGDAGKLYLAPPEYHDAYHFTCDDDLEYPTDYAEKMVAAVERYHRKAVVGLHGIELHTPLRPTYRWSRRRVYHFAEENLLDQAVHILGTGCMAYHCSTIYVCDEDCHEPNMADIWFALACQRAGVPRVAIAHEAGWVKQLPFESSIWDRRQNDPRLIEALRRGQPWGAAPSLPCSLRGDT